jgi:hypothetical protein
MEGIELTKVLFHHGIIKASRSPKTVSDQSSSFFKFSFASAIAGRELIDLWRFERGIVKQDDFHSAR